jgi:phage shock protein PspC (stress-responsive transcriptional regulator)/signal transduction histidine kinase
MTTVHRPLIPGLPPQLHRSADDRWVSGVCGGVGAYFGVDPVVVRLATVVLTVVSGVGILLYIAAWLLLPDGEPAAVDATAGPTGPSARRSRPHGHEKALAIGFVTVGSLLLLRSLGLWFPDHLVWPISIVAVGIALVWTRTDEATRTRVTPVRIIGGSVLLVAGLATFLATNDSFATLGAVGMAVLVTALGAGLLAGPWVLRLWRQLTEERRERIRQAERAEMAAHLHDSVLQTLALIQRRSGSPQETMRLARRQERELRAWLYGDRDRAVEDTLAGALEAIADEVEADHAVQVEVVVAGDCALDDRLRALVDASREAVVNAAKHAGVGQVLVFAEVTPDHVSAYVRDRGKGFDPSSVDGGRRGIADSIVGRMQRHGGVAAVLSEPGAGTEVVLEIKMARA